MITSESKIRIRYGETDKMGYVYYGNYPLYYEVGRTNMIRELGITYDELENEGILMPVYNLVVNYIKAAKYDELITVKTYLKELPSVRIIFDYEIYNEANELINTGETTLLFLDEKTRKPRKAPEKLLKVLSSKF